MGDYVNGNAASILGWLTTALMAAAAIALLATGGISIWPDRFMLTQPGTAHTRHAGLAAFIVRGYTGWSRLAILERSARPLFTAVIAG